MKQLKNYLGLFALAVTGLFTNQAAALSSLGTLDTNFNSTGTVITPIGSNSVIAYATAVQPDGKIIVAGLTSGTSNSGFAVVRYNADGTLDTGFNATGMAIVGFGTNSGEAHGVVVQPDGKIVVAGFADGVASGNTDFALVRFNSDGSLDSSFGSGGKVTTDFASTYDYAGGLALQADGKLVVSGYIDHNTSVFDYALARYNTDGSLDTGFGTGGLVTTVLNTNNDWPVTVALQPDGKILIGSAYNTTGADFFVARYTTNGVLDTTFNSGGSLAPGAVTTDLGSTNEVVTALLVQPDGKIVAVGKSGTPSNMALVRYNSNGSLDTSFGESGNGKETFNPQAGAASAQAATLQPNGKIVAAGASSNGSNDDFGLVRFTSAGIPDSAQLTNISTYAGANAIALQPDGKIVAAGYVVNGSDNIAVVRYVSSDAPWDLTPDAFAFTDATNVAHLSVQTSDMITIAGLDSSSSVPLTVSGGQYAKNGATSYTSDPGWVQNGDTVNVRHTSASGNNQTTNTVLTVGGLMPNNNYALNLGTSTSDTFSSTTSTLTAGGGSGGGVFSPWMLALLIAACWRKQVRRVTSPRP